MGDLIVFPFNYKKDNKEMFVKTFQMARLTNAKVVLLTVISEDAPEEEYVEVYNHLFELNGFFQTYFNKWKKIGIAVERVIRRGDLSKNLVEYIRELKIQVNVVVTPKSKEMNKERLEVLFKKLANPPNLIR